MTPSGTTGCGVFFSHLNSLPMYRIKMRGGYVESLLPVPEVIISIITDREYMENLHRDYYFLRELERSKVAV
jgi:hypothetical protein